MALRKPEHPTFPGLLDGASPGRPSPGEANVSRECAAEACAECGLDPCACAELDPELAAQVSAAVEELAAATIDQPPAAADALLDDCRRRQQLTQSGYEAAAAFLQRRQELLDAHSIKACVDLSQPAERMAREARDRFAAIHERLQGEPSAEQRDAAFKSLLSAGALAFALFDKLTMEK